MKKKVLIIIGVLLLVFAIVFAVVLVSDKKENNDILQTTENSVVSLDEDALTELSTQATTVHYEEATDPTGSVEHTSDKIVIKNWKYTFEIPKTDFESKYSEKELFMFLDFIPLSFGCDDYYDWSGDGNQIINDMFLNCISSPFYYKSLYKTYDLEVDRYAFVRNEIGDNYMGFKVTTIKDLNEFIESWYGPKARVLTKDDFMNINDAKKNQTSLFEGTSDISSNAYYLPESDMVAITTLETGFSAYSSYIYDIKKDGKDIVIYTVGSVENYLDNSSFEAHQKDLLSDLCWGEDKTLENNIYTVSYTWDGKMYLKSVESKKIIAKEIGYNYEVDADAERIPVLNRYAYTEEMEIIGYIYPGDNVCFYGYTMYKKEYASVITKDIQGYIDPKYVDYLIKR